MKLHDPITFEAHRNRSEGQLIYIANLKGWTLAEAIERDWEMSDTEIDNDVAPPADEAPKSRRGRPKGATAKQPASSNLLAAVEFVSVVETDAFENSQYALFSNGQISAYSNMLAAGHPIEEELTLCPQIEKLKAALARCGKSLAITETNGQISIKGDKLRAIVPCLAEPIAAAQPDPAVINGEFDILKQAFTVCAKVADENADRMMCTSVLLDPNSATATNGKVLIQFWHGIANLPPGTVVPKIFAQKIAASKYKIIGIGGNYDQSAGFMRSLTVWFENGSWLKTQCYEERWQSIDAIINVQTNPVPAPAGLFDAIAAVEPFTDEHGGVFFGPNCVSSHMLGSDVGAVYEVKGLTEGKVFNSKLIRDVAPYVAMIDIKSFPDRGFFFGGANNEVRGVFMGMAGSK